MNDEINKLSESLDDARKQSDELNNEAYILRQEAVRAQFKATAAAETAAITVELLTKCTDPVLFEALALSSRQALRKTIQATEEAATAVEKANDADRRVTEAFKKCRDLADELTAALDHIERLGFLQSTK